MTRISRRKRSELTDSGEFAPEHLDGHHPPGGEFAGRVHHGRPAAAKFPLDGVVVSKLGGEVAQDVGQLTIRLQ